MSAPADSAFSRFLAGHPAAYRVPEATAQPEVRVVDFGADPTAITPSDAAFNKAITALLAHRGSAGHSVRMAGNITDLGGAVLQLSGGTYLLERPLQFPDFYGNFKVVFGTLRASASTFPKDRFIIEIGGSADECKRLDPKQKSCNENIGLEDLTIDANRRAYGGVSINATMGANVGPDIFIINFIHSGLTVNGGHEVMLHQSWFGATYYDAKKAPDGLMRIGGSCAVELFGNDHIASDVIVFSAQVGLRTTGGANVIRGVHTWNEATLLGGSGIIVEAASTRLMQVYLDYSSLYLVDPIQDVTVADSFFLGMGNIVLVSTVAGKGKVDGLAIVENTFSNWNMPQNTTVVVDERSGMHFTNIMDFTMQSNAGCPKMSTRGVTVTGTSWPAKTANRFEVSFADQLVFPNAPIRTLRYMLEIAEPGVFVREALRPPHMQNASVAIETDSTVHATATITVTQSSYRAGNGV